MININNKRWDLVDEKDIVSVLKGNDDENFFFEFKSDDESPSKLVKEISAFANTYGGYVFLGIRDDKSIGGCEKWTEQRIHATIHDSLSPLPSFDVRRFVIDGETVLVIRVEEGTLPPYVTGKGYIFERVSSGSFPIKDSARMAHLYNKRANQIAQVKAKIEFGDIDKNDSIPQNLCAYLDIGFSITCSEPTFLQKHFFDIDLSNLKEELSNINYYSASRVGNALMFTIGQVTQNGEKTRDPIVAGLHNYLIVYDDCSASFRFLLFSNGESNLVDISIIPLIIGDYASMFRLLCGDDFSKIFIHAQKYEHLKVIKQFVPVYDVNRYFNHNEKNPFESLLNEHRMKYGENLIVQSNRTPISGYNLIDKQWFDKNRIEYNQTELITELFSTQYMYLGYIDPLNYQKAVEC